MEKRAISALPLLVCLAVLALPKNLACAADIPTPESHFGHKIGVDRELLDWDKVVSYFNALAKTSDRIDAILRNNILLLVPSLNPDGVDIVTQWYRRTLNTPWEGTSPPELWQKYVGHDNNRDRYIFSQPETRATISQLHNGWHAEIDAKSGSGHIILFGMRPQNRAQSYLTFKPVFNALVMNL